MLEQSRSSWLIPVSFRILCSIHPPSSLSLSLSLSVLSILTRLCCGGYWAPGSRRGPWPPCLGPAADPRWPSASSGPVPAGWRWARGWRASRPWPVWPAGGWGGCSWEGGWTSSRPPGSRPCVRTRPPAGSRPGWCQTSPEGGREPWGGQTPFQGWEFITNYRNSFSNLVKATNQTCRKLFGNWIFHQKPGIW